MRIPDTATFSNATEVHGPGDYFVSAIDGDRYWLMLGPFPTHAAAAARVEEVRRVANGHDPRACFMAWGVCRLDPGSRRVGNMNRLGVLS